MLGKQARKKRLTEEEVEGARLLIRFISTKENDPDDTICHIKVSRLKTEQFLVRITETLLITTLT